MATDIKALGNAKYHGITAGIAAASKALVLDASTNVSGINSLSAVSLSATHVTATTDLTLNSGATLKFGSTNLVKSELDVLDAVTAGTVTASKALVVDASKNLSTLGNLTTTTYTVASGGTIVSDKGTTTASGSGTAATATINKMAGVVTTTSMSSAAGATYVLTVSNSVVASTDIILCSMNTASAGTPIIQTIAPAGGSFVVTIYNAHASTAFNNTAAIAYLVIK